MKQVLLSMSDGKKAQTLLAFLKQIDFVQVKETDKYLEMAKIEAEIAESLNDLKKGNIIPWKGKKVTLK
ncbi:MAG: hypothetical protein ABII90_12890 [Bacteroidota bacterium]